MLFDAQSCSKLFEAVWSFLKLSEAVRYHSKLFEAVNKAVDRADQLCQ